MTDKTNRLLLIVDPQIDFITGTLPVPGAEKAMDAVSEYVEEHGSDYELICVTCDRHPICHSSFADFGGQWPSHCVESSVGAAVWPPLMMALKKHSALVRFLYKGQDLKKDEYSIFKSVKGDADMKMYVEDFDISSIDICGLAGDICVANTINDAVRRYPNLNFQVLEQFTASLDGGKLISSLTFPLL